MGNSNGTFPTEEHIDLWWENTCRRRNNVQQQTKHNNNNNINGLSKNGSNDGPIVPKEISHLHQKRLRIIEEKRKEFDRLRQELQSEKTKNCNLRLVLKQNGIDDVHVEESPTSMTITSEENDNSKIKISQLTAENEQLKAKIVLLECKERKEMMAVEEKNRKLQIEIAKLQSNLQVANAEMITFEKERREYNTHVAALKDIIKVSKELLEIRQNQIVQLNSKIEKLEKAVSDKEIVAYSNELREEYEKQLTKIKELRTLYEERQTAAENAKENFKKDLEECQKKLQEEETKSEDLSKRIEELTNENSEKYDKIASLELCSKMRKAECNELQAQLSVINQLFSEIILGFRNGHEIDMDQLIDVLEENHDLLTNIVVNEESNEVSSTLPKVLLDLINRVKVSELENKRENHDERDAANETTETQEIHSPEEAANPSNLSMNSAAEIVKNLPKVWKVLAELLSHQQIPVNNLIEKEKEDNKTTADPCYKSVQTPNGSRLALNVSGTFIRLKDLIIEKKSLEKETFHLKQLNCHLETRLQDQEKRLELVTAELSKTWHVVGKMQKQHQHLHTQEKILRYELAQKRKLLTELKEELEYCREKWLKAREKNNKTEMEWKELRNEFASRKSNLNDDLNNSIESGYSDERDISSDDDVVYERESPSSTSPEAALNEDDTETTIETVAIVPHLQLLDVAVEEKPILSDSIRPKIEENDMETSNVPLDEKEIVSDQVTHSTNSIGDNFHMMVELGKEKDCANNCRLWNPPNPSSSSSPSPSLSKSKNRQTEIEETYKRLETDIILSVAKAQKGESFNIVVPSTSARNHLIYPSILKRECVRHFPSYSDETILAKPQRSQLSETTTDFEPTSSSSADCEKPSTSTSTTSFKDNRTPSEILATRDERLKKLEEQCKQLTFKILSNNYRGCQMYRKLSDLHEKHGYVTEETDSSSSDSDEQ